MPYGYSEAVWGAAKSEAIAAMKASARRRGMITYTQLTERIGAIDFRPEDFALHALLGEISTDEHSAGRGMLTVLVVHKVGDMEPGNGFYELARQLGRLKHGSDPVKFWIEELHRVHSQ